MTPKPLKSIGIDEVAHDRMRAGLVTKVIEHITILVHEWFSGIKPQLLIPCPYCMESKPHTTEINPSIYSAIICQPCCNDGTDFTCTERRD